MSCLWLVSTCFVLFELHKYFHFNLARLNTQFFTYVFFLYLRLNSLPTFSSSIPSIYFSFQMVLECNFGNAHPFLLLHLLRPLLLCATMTHKCDFRTTFFHSPCRKAPNSLVWHPHRHRQRHRHHQLSTSILIQGPEARETQWEIAISLFFYQSEKHLSSSNEFKTESLFFFWEIGWH